MRHLIRPALLLAALCVGAVVGLGQNSNSNNGQLAPNAPPDKPVHAGSQDEVAQIEAAIRSTDQGARR